MNRPQFDYGIAFDAMGGDRALEITLPAAIRFAQRYPQCRLTLVGHRQKMEQALQGKRLALQPNMEMEHAEDQVLMGDNPIKALRTKKQSSMYQAIRMVQEGQADACVSAGNTGALMAMCWYLLKPIAPIERPAIATAIPNIHGHVYVLDLGANVSRTAKGLYQCAFMGSKMCELLDDKPAPKVALINVGTEDGKGGHKAIFEADSQLRQSALNYVGYVEGDAVFMGDVDVIVCDGFVGNVALKISEGLARMISAQLKEDLQKGWINCLGSLLLRGTLKRSHRRLNPSNYGGALLVGLEKIVVKAHGGSDVHAMMLALEGASKEIEEGLVSKLAESLKVESFLSH